MPDLCFSFSVHIYAQIHKNSHVSSSCISPSCCSATHTSGGRMLKWVSSQLAQKKLLSMQIFLRRQPSFWPVPPSIVWPVRWTGQGMSCGILVPAPLSAGKLTAGDQGWGCPLCSVCHRHSLTMFGLLAVRAFIVPVLLPLQAVLLKLTKSL